MKTSIETSKSPAPIGPYSQAVKSGNTLYVSGQIPINPANGQLMMEDIQSETRQVMENLKNILEKAGMSFDNVVKTSIFLIDMNNFSAINEVYGSYFSGNYPARETVQVSGLPRGVNVEISVIATE